MKFIAQWGRQDLPTRDQPGEQMEYGRIDFEAETITAAKAKATRAMKADEKMRPYTISYIEDKDGNKHPLQPPRWTPWTNHSSLSKRSETLDRPIVYVDPKKAPKNQHPGHYGYLILEADTADKED